MWQQQGLTQHWTFSLLKQHLFTLFFPPVLQRVYHPSATCVYYFLQCLSNNRFFLNLRGYWQESINLKKQKLFSIELEPSFAAREALQSWQEKNHKWLELTDVHRESTNNVRITVMPFYMGIKVCWVSIFNLGKRLIYVPFKAKCERRSLA